MKHSIQLTTLTILILAVIFGCSPVPARKTLSEAHEKFLKICEETYGLKVILTPLKNTVWIYIPIKGNIYDLKATKSSDSSQKPTPKPSINFIEGDFKNSSFKIDYDISITNAYPQKGGYSISQNEEFNKAYRHIYEAILRSYFDVEKLPGQREFEDPRRNTIREKMIETHIRTEKTPDFFIVVFADVTNGIQSKTIFYIEDYKRYATQSLPYDEYAKRLISEVTGVEEAIGDLTGEHLKYDEITWPEFLAKQITSRAKFKYQHSHFIPGDDAKEEILTCVVDTISAYGFSDFQSVSLNDLRSEVTYELEKEELLKRKSSTDSSQGQYHVIEFDPAGRMK